MLVLAGASQRLEASAQSSTSDPNHSGTQAARLLLPFWAVNTLLIAALLWELGTLLNLAQRCAPQFFLGFPYNRTDSAKRAAILAILLAVAVPCEVVIAMSDARGSLNVDALIGALLVLTGFGAIAACVFALAACHRERRRDLQLAIQIRIEGPDRGSRTCYKHSPSRQRGIAGRTIVVLHAPGLSPIDM